MSKKVVLTSDISKQNNIDAASQQEPIAAKDNKELTISGDDSPKRTKSTHSNNRKNDQPIPGKVAKRIKIYKTLLPRFQKQYPKCFTIPQSPLAIGIGKMLVEEDDTQTAADIKKFLSMYVNTVTYNESIIEGENRIDLYGNNVSIISADDASFAKAKIVAIKAARSKSQ